ncbi:MAG: RluA family pseudouridine synthase [Treponema sp.]|nr:RluA family pseudouridine synthase [Treponema sp.]
MNPTKILYSDDEIYLIDKVSGLAVQGGKGITHSLDLDFAKEVGHKVYLVHRLDKETSGLMIVAKTPLAAKKWTKLISSKQVKKEYYAICAGTINPKKGTITEDLEQHGKEKSAVTSYQVDKEWTIDYVDGENQVERINMTNIRLQLETGRMHQIRIHLSKLNCPIAGDDLHGNFKLNKKLKKALKIKSLLLCSKKLSLPINNQIKTFEIPLPSHMDFESYYLDK